MKVEGIKTTIRDDAVREINRLAGELLQDTSNAIMYTAKEIVPVRTGALRKDIQVTKLDKTELKSEVGVTLEYGKFVEQGTVKMDSQPYLIPALEEVMQTINDGMKP